MTNTDTIFSEVDLLAFEHLSQFLGGLFRVRYACHGCPAVEHCQIPQADRGKSSKECAKNFRVWARKAAVDDYLLQQITKPSPELTKLLGFEPSPEFIKLLRERS